MRRRGRTILTLLGLAVGVGLVIAIAGLSKGLDEAQSATLDPLAGIGTDLTVTRTAAGGRGRRAVRRRPRHRRGEPGRHHRPLQARQAGNALRPRLLPAGDAAHLHPGAGEADRRARGRLRRLRRPHPAGRPPGGEGAEDRRQDPDRRRPNRRQPSDRAADRGRAGPDPVLPARSSESSCRRLARRLHAARTRVAASAAREPPSPGAFAKCLPAAHAALPRHDHDAARDAAASARPAADGHRERVLHDRRRPAGRPDDGPRHGVAGEHRPLSPPRPRGSRLRDLRGAQQAEGRVEARPERDVVHRRRTRRPAARRPGRRRLPAARAAAEALRARRTSSTSSSCAPTTVRRSRRWRSGSRRRTNRPRSRVRRRSRERSAALSSTRPTSPTASGSLSRSSRQPQRSCSRRCSRSRPSASASASSGTLKALGWTQGKVVRQVAAESLTTGVLGGILGVVLGVSAALLVGVVRADADRQLDHGGREPVRCRAGRAHDRRDAVSLDGARGRDDRARRLRCSPSLGGLIAGAAGALRAARLRPADALRTVE